MEHNSDVFGRIGECVRENLGAKIEGLVMIRSYNYGDNTEDHFLLLGRQPGRRPDGGDGFCVHTVAHHSSGSVGIVGSGDYFISEDAEERARKRFAENVNLPWPGRIPSS